jgi:hypothetical protein
MNNLNPKAIAYSVKQLCQVTIFGVLFFASLTTFAQEELKYRRSSLSMILVESHKLPNNEKIEEAYANFPFPDKYNEHNIEQLSFTPTAYEITDEDRIAAGGKAPSKGGKMMGKIGGGMLKSNTGGLVDLDTLAKDVPLQIERFIQDKEVAKQLVAKWFNRTADGKMDYELIKSRGLYSALEEDKELANATASAEDYLFDMELIGNTFVVFNRLKFTPNEPVAKLTLEAALASANEIEMEMARLGAVKAANAAYEKMKEGYTVFTKTWLYQLHWNDTVARTFTSYFLNENIDAVAAWDTTKLFKLNLVGEELSSSIVTFSFKEKRTEDQIITLSVNRNVDAVLAKLQKKYEVFRPITPMASVGPVTARIGLKEGLEGGESFDVLESRKDAKTGQYKYVSVGSVSVDKKQPIWDNRFKEKPDIEALVEAALAGTPIEVDEPTDGPEYTTFKGGKKVQLGMHFLRLKK